MTKKMAIAEVEKCLVELGIWWVGKSRSRLWRIRKDDVLYLSNILRYEGLKNFQSKAFEFGLEISSCLPGNLRNVSAYGSHVLG